MTRVIARGQELRARQHAAEAALEAARAQRERVRAELVSLDALQRAALGEADQDSAKWLKSTGLAQRPRATSQLSVDAGWERAVEAVLGDRLEAVSVDGLEDALQALETSTAAT